MRGLLAVLMLGADAAYMGTRFMMAAESEAHARVKEMLLKGDDVCTVSLKKQKMLVRDFRNRFAKGYSNLIESGASADSLNAFLSEHSQYHSQHLGEADEAEICCGQVAGLINGIERAGDIIAKMVNEVASNIETLKKKGQPFTS